jgi:hypothetical protein
MPVLASSDSCNSCLDAVLRAWQGARGVHRRSEFFIGSSFLLFVKLSGRDCIIVFAALVVAVWAGLHIADAAVMLPVFAGGILFCVIVAHVSPVGFNPLVLGLLIAGYVLGNRGFAQLSISGNVPLFPAELGIAASLTVLLWHCAQEKKLPWRNDFLNWALILWVAVSTVRLPFDVRTHGAMALRDNAMVSYA